MGRLSLFTKRDKKHKIKEFESGELQKTTQGTRFLGKLQKDVLNSTVKNILRDGRLKSYKMSLILEISSKNLALRKKYYLKIKKFTYQDFKKINFSDESPFQLLNTRRKQNFFKNATTQTGNKLFI